MASEQEKRLERIENALLLLAGGVVGRAGVGRSISAASRLPGVGPAAGIGLGLEALQTDTGQMLLDLAEERGRKDRLALERFIQDTTFRTKEKVVRSSKKKKSKFNKAVSASMKSLKASASYGKKGVISNAKAAFKTATKAASARAAGKKMPKSGPAKIAYKAAKTVYTDEILRRKKK
tara:strand:- start:15 stop:548 length:534 start_codon:yes stop_codon:yes gene_type:complete